MSKTYIDKLAWIHIVDGKIFSTVSKGKDTWYIPGGKREEGETDEQAVIREIKEELSIDLVSETLELVGVYEAQAHGKPEGTVVRMTCYTSEFTGEITPDSEIDRVGYLTYNDKDKTSPVDHLIFDDLKDKGLLS